MLTLSQSQLCVLLENSAHLLKFYCIMQFQCGRLKKKKKKKKRHTQNEARKKLKQLQRDIFLSGFSSVIGEVNFWFWKVSSEALWNTASRGKGEHIPHSSLSLIRHQQSPLGRALIHVYFHTAGPVLRSRKSLE